MTRICITGGPRTGKTTLADWMETGGATAACPADVSKIDKPIPVKHTDDLIEQFKHLHDYAWSAASAEAMKWLDEPDPWIIEGVAVSLALRKWHEAHPGEPPPVDHVIYLDEPHNTLSNGQETMAKGVRTVHDEIEVWLEEHGITTEYL